MGGALQDQPQSWHGFCSAMLTSVSAWEVTIAVVPSARLCHLCFELRKLTRTAASSRILVFLLLFLASCDFNSSTMQCYSSTISCTMSSALCTCHNMTVVTSMIIRHLTSHKSACPENDDSVITAELEFFHQLRVWQFNHLGSKKKQERHNKTGTWVAHLCIQMSVKARHKKRIFAT